MNHYHRKSHSSLNITGVKIQVESEMQEAETSWSFRGNALNNTEILDLDSDQSGR